MEPKLLTAVRFVDSTCGISYRYVYSDTEYFRPHFHDYYEVFLLLEGAVTHHVNGHAVPLGRGSLVFIRPNDTHDYLLRAGERFSMLNLTATRDPGEGQRASPQQSCSLLRCHLRCCWRRVIFSTFSRK